MINNTFAAALFNEICYMSKRERKSTFMRGLSLNPPKDQNEFDCRLDQYNLTAGDFTFYEREQIEDLIN